MLKRCALGGPFIPLSFVMLRKCLVELLSWKGFLIPSSLCPIDGVCPCRHIFFIWMMFSFCFVGSKKNIRCLLKVFQSYSDAPGQLVNFDQSKLFIGAMTATHRNMLAQMSGFTVGTIPFQYLGCPIFQGRPKCICNALLYYLFILSSLVSFCIFYLNNCDV